MSGGSYDYFFLMIDVKRLKDLERISNTLDEMIKWVDSHKHDPEGDVDVFNAVVKFLHKYKVEIDAMITYITAKHERLADLFKAIEWWDSGDWSAKPTVQEWRVLMGQ